MISCYGGGLEANKTIQVGAATATNVASTELVSTGECRIQCKQSHSSVARIQSASTAVCVAGTVRVSVQLHGVAM